MNQRAKVRTLFVMVMLFMALACSFDAGPVATATDTPKRINALAPLPEWISILPAEDCSQGCWQVDRKATRYLPEGESNGLHHVFLKTFSIGEQVGGVTWFLEWPGGRDAIQSKPFPDWADAAMWACFFPDQNQTGPYALYVQEKARSDVVQGLGLPYCHHESIEAVMVWNPGGETPTPTPTATAPPLPEALYLPLILNRN